MNSKLIKACVAGTAAVAVTAGGGTFAKWTAYDTITQNSSGAGKLVLDVTNDQGGTQGFSVGNLAPGEFQEFEVFLASTNGDAVPDAELFMTLVDLDGIEDGCTSTSEKTNVDGTDNDVDCSNLNTDGEFKDQAVIQTVYGVPANGGCNPNLSGFSPSGTITQIAPTLAAAEDQRLHLSGPQFTQTGDPRAELNPGEEVCARLKVWLPDTADNKSQGDSATYSLLFEVEQIVGTGGGNGYQNQF